MERTFKGATSEISEKVDALKHATRRIQGQVKGEEQEIGRLTALVEKMSSAEQDKETKDLTSKISKAYNECHKDARDDPDTLQMLVSIEATLEDLMVDLNRLRSDDKQLVAKLEKAVEKRRREHWRKLRLEEQRRTELSRQARLEDPVHVKVGKQLMFRSAKPQVKKVVVDTSEEEALKRDHDLFGVHIGKDGVRTEAPEIPAY